MKITLKLHAQLTDRLPPGTQGRAVVLDVDDDTCVGEILARHDLPPGVAHLVLVNGHYIAPAARPSRRLSDGDHLAVWPPIAGG